MSASCDTARGRSATASAAQRRVALAARLRPHDPATNFAVLCRLPAGTDARRMADAVRTVVDSDDSYNETFEIDADGLVIATRIHGVSTCPVNRYRSLPELRAAVQRRADVPFDVGTWPLYHAEIAVVADDLYFVLTGSHLVTDGLGFLELGEAIDECYRTGQVEGCTRSPSELDGAVPNASAVDYFSELLAGMDNLTIDGWGRRDAHGRIVGSITRYERPLDPYASAVAIARRLGVRRFTVLLTAFGSMVAMLSRQPRVVVSTPLSNRRATGELSRTRGLLTNALPVNIDTQGCETFDELCVDVDRQVSALIEYEDFPFADVARDMLRDGDIDATVPSASFTLYPRPIAVVVDGEPAVPVLVDRDYLQYPFSVNIEVGPGSVTLITERAADVPDVDVGAVFWNTLRQAATQPGVRLSNLSWTDSAETASRCPVRRSFEPARTIVDEFVDAARTNSAAVAVECGTQRITYRELDERADAVARAIDAALPAAERFVAVSMTPSIELVAVLLGVLKSGRAYVPVDSELPRPRVQSMVRAFGELTLVGDRPDDWRGIAGLRHESLQRVGATADRPTPPRPADTAYVIFTSGTTGEPKGVPVTHASVTSMLSSVAAVLPVRDKRWSLYHSFSFDASVWEMFGALVFGGVLCIPTSPQRSDPDRMAHFLREARIDVLSQTPSAFEVLGPRIEAESYSPETVVFFGEPVNFDQLKEFARRHDRTRLVNMYGITETTVHAAFYQLPSAIDQWPTASVIGDPLCDKSIMVLDAERRVLPRGCPGELAIGGAGVMSGYLHRDDLTHERIAVIDGERVYLSGDLGLMTRIGRLHYLGRLDSQVQVRGHRIELSEIEQALRDCEGVDAACAIATGEGITRHVVGFVVGSRSGIEDVTSFLRARLPSYMVPSRIVGVAQLPLTINGKTDRAALLRIARDGADDVEHSPIADHGSAVEDAINRVWADVLGHDRFERDTRFFDAGGSSALLLRVSLQLRTVLDVDDLDVIDLFEHCTPATLAAHLHDQRLDPRKAIP